MNMNKTIYASFATIDDAEHATGALMDFGLHAEDISLIAHEQHKTLGLKYTAHDLNRSEDHAAVYTDERNAGTEHHGLDAKAGISTTTGADAAVGAGKGTGIGLGVGVVAALAAMFIPGVGLVIGGGALALALGGAAAAAGAGAIAGGALGFMKDQGVNEESINLYRDTFEKGGAILAVQLQDDVEESSVDVILSKYNALNISGVTYATPY
jgi:hypothetical protein